MKIIRTILSFILIPITPLISFLTFESVGYKYIYYDFNSDKHSNVKSRVMIGETVYLNSPQNVVTVTYGIGYVHTFEGWYLDENFTFPIENFNMPKHDVNVYGEWFSNTWEGNSTENHLFNMISGHKYTIDLTYNGGQFIFLKFIPANSRQYTFESSSTSGTSAYQDTKAYLYQASIQNEIAFNDSGYNSNGHFRITYNLISSRVYYLKVQYYWSWQTGRFDVSVT